MTSAAVSDGLDTPPDDRFGRFAIGRTSAGFEEDRPRPRLSAGPTLVEFDEPNRLDPVRAAAVQAAADDDRRPALLSQFRSRYSPAAWVMAAAVYAVTLLLFMPWVFSASEPEPAIPVTLVIEKPPPPPPAAPSEEKKQALGPLSSEDMGATGPKKPEAAAPPPPPQESTVAAIAPPPRPAPPPELESSLPKPTPTPAEVKLPEIPKPAPPYEEPPTHPVVARLPPKREPSPHTGRVPGPDATADQYLAYCKSLVLRYVGTLLLNGRSGETVIGIVVLDNGTISRAAVKRSSGYLDIDERAENILARIHRFPPLPQWYQGSSIQFDLHLVFRNGEVLY